MKSFQTKSVITKLTFLKRKMKNDGAIDMKQYKKVMKDLDLSIPKEEAEKLFKMSDKTCSGSLNAEELNKLIIQLSNITFPEQTQ